jgi:HK97 family phage major capsid protein
MSATQSELRLARLIDERAVTEKLHESVLGAVESREDKAFSESESSQVQMYREKATELDAEIEQLAEEIERHTRSIETSKQLKRVLAGTTDGVDADDEGVIYRSMAAYARDVILTSNGRTASSIASQFASPEELDAARTRLQLIKRTPANTLSSNVAGLIPPQHISQIFQVIDDSRPLVASAQRDTLERGTLTYPFVATRPVVAVQSTEKTEAGNTGMSITMVTATASTYLGGGDLSWQAVNWSTPNALDTWFRLAAADYALKTEQDAAQALQHSGFTYNISSTLAASSTFAQWMTAIGAGYSDVFTNSGRVADTLYLSPDLFGYLLGLTSSAFTQFMSVSANNMGPLNIVVSRGMDAGVAVCRRLRRVCLSRRRPVRRSSSVWSSLRSAGTRSASSARSRPSLSILARSR